MDRLSPKYLLFIILSFMVLGLFSCGNTAEESKLKEAEKLMYEQPDSAYQIISTLDSTTLTETGKSRQALLAYFMGVLHNANVPKSEPEWTMATHDFDGRLNSDEVKSLIIKSHDAFTSGDPVGRLEYLKDAEFLAEQIDDKEDLAVVYLELANVYKMGFNYAVERYYAEKALFIFSSYKRMKQILESRMTIAGSIAEEGNVKVALDSMIAMREDVRKHGKVDFQYFYESELAKVYVETGEIRKGIQVWADLSQKTAPSSNILSHWARAYLLNDQPDSALILINKAIETPHNSSDEFLARNVESMIYENLGQSSEAKQAEQLRTAAGEKINSERQLQQTSLAVNKKYESATREAWSELSRKKYQNALIIGIAVILFIIALAVEIISRKNRRLQKAVHENDILKIEALQNSIFEKDARQKDLADKIEQLMGPRIKLLDSLASTYFESKESGTEQKRIFGEVKKIIEDFKLPNTINELELAIDSYSENLWSDFSKDYSNLSESQRKLALYLFCGFNFQAISIFTGTDIRNLYVYKSRLKKTILLSECERKEEYLTYLEGKRTA